MPGGTDKFKRGAHYCRPPMLKKAGKVWTCKKCWAVYTCKEVRGRLVWLQTRSGMK